MKKIILIILPIMLLSVWTLNIYTLNNQTPKRSETIFYMGDWVEYGNNFYEKSTENRNGYSIKVIKAEVIAFDEYLKNHHISIFRDAELFTPQYVYDVSVIIKNKNNTTSGINMIDTTLNSINNVMQIDFDIFDALYPQLSGSVSFSIKPNTEMEFHFPFVIANADFEKICDYNYLTSNIFYLNLSQYPTKQSIEVKAA